MKNGNDLRILSCDKCGSLLYHIDQLPYQDARVLETELKETYREWLDECTNWKHL